jgi:hypothetical protein
MHDREFEARKDDPDDVHDQRECAARGLGFAHLAAEWCQDAAGELEALDAERNPDDRQAKDYSAEQVAEEDQESTEDKEQDIASSSIRAMLHQ